MATWHDYLHQEKTKPYFKELLHFLNERRLKSTVYPAKEDWFKALTLTPYDAVKVVILGQDPYHQKGQAMGLSFSVPKTVPIPPSLRNIYQELYNDLGYAIPHHGDLTAWAKQGVLLLNTTLTVEDSRPMAHAKSGWEVFTNAIIKALNHKESTVVFMLWGRHAQTKEKLITNHRHLILKAAHPSPLSAHRGFLGCRHFSKANRHLEKHHLKPIDYRLPLANLSKLDTM